VRERAFAVFHGINDMERNVFADEIASLITGDVYRKALLRAVAARLASERTMMVEA
jgi:hypothetical protein